MLDIIIALIIQKSTRFLPTIHLANWYIHPVIISKQMMKYILFIYFLAFIFQTELLSVFAVNILLYRATGADFCYELLRRFVVSFMNRGPRGSGG